MIAIVDYGVGNSGSILNMLKKVGAEAGLAAEPDIIRQADKLILPGVGSFDNGMTRLRETGLVPVLEEEVLRKGKPVVGICLGMQMLGKSSEEGQVPGLGWLNFGCVRFRFTGEANNLKIPHMGWNEVAANRPHSLLNGLEEPARFYFVHSYRATCENEADIIGTTYYGGPFPSVVGRDNIVGVQFHPEKSHRFGIQLFKNFVERF